MKNHQIGIQEEILETLRHLMNSIPTGHRHHRTGAETERREGRRRSRLRPEEGAVEWILRRGGALHDGSLRRRRRTGKLCCTCISMAAGQKLLFPFATFCFEIILTTECFICSETCAVLT